MFSFSVLVSIRIAYMICIIYTIVVMQTLFYLSTKAEESVEVILQLPFPIPITEVETFMYCAVDALSIKMSTIKTFLEFQRVLN